MAGRGKGCAIGCIGLVIAGAVMAGGAFLAFKKVTEIQGGSVTMEAPGTRVVTFEPGLYMVMREGASSDLSVEIAPEAGGEPLALSPTSMSMNLNQYRGWRQFEVATGGGYTVAAFMQEGSSEMLLFLRLDEFTGIFTVALVPILVGGVIGLIALIWGAVVFFRKT